MNENGKLQELMEKYLAAETTLEEEELLKEKYLKGDTLEGSGEMRALFGYFEDQKNFVKIPDFENPSEKILARHSSKIVPMSWISAAASVLLLVGIYYYIIRSEKPLPEDTYSDPVVAAQSAVEALNFLSAEINRGTNITRQQIKELDNINMHFINFQSNQ